MSEELKPCPFCGGEVEIKNWADENQWSAECSECGVGESYNDSSAQAVKFWNTRHIPEGYALIKLDSVLVPRGQPMPQTVEAWQYLGHQYEKGLLEQKDEISKLKADNNKLRQKLKGKEGYALVPVEPTGRQLEAGKRAIDENGGEGDYSALLSDASEAYKAMITAAQESEK